MKVTNNTSNPMVIGGTHIAASASGEVEDWDTVKETFAVKQFLKAEAISTGKAAAKSKTEEDEERKALFAELDKLKVTYDKKAATPDLLVLLDDAKKKAAAQ